MEKEKAEKLVIAALSYNETDGLPHQELKVEPETTNTNAERICGEIAIKVEKPDQVGGEVMNVENLENESSVGLPPTKKSRLGYEAIIMGEMLSDIHINLAQSVLKVQFNKQNGFESTLYQGKEVKWTEEKITSKFK